MFAAVSTGSTQFPSTVTMYGVVRSANAVSSAPTRLTAPPISQTTSKLNGAGRSCARSAMTPMASSDNSERYSVFQ
jgi:hypothetical protein